MTVGAISSIASTVSYSTSVEYQYFGTAMSDDQIQLLMSQYGITQTDDPDADLKALYDAMYSSAESQVSATTSGTQSQSAQQSSAQNSTNVPWASLMNAVNLPVSGDLNTDYQNFNQKINTMETAYSASQSSEGLAYVNQLNAEAQMVFVQTSQSTNSVSQSQTGQAQATGADIMAQLNKLLMVGV